MVPFWLVDVTHVEAESNMKLTIDATKTSIDSYDPEVSCAVMKNHKAIKPDDKIIHVCYHCVFKICSLGLHATLSCS